MPETCDCGRPVENHFPLDCFNELRNGWDKADATVQKLANDFTTMIDLSNATIASLREALAAARREVEGYRKELQLILDLCTMPSRCDLPEHHIARAALAAPAAASGEEGKP